MRLGIGYMCLILYFNGSRKVVCGRGFQLLVYEGDLLIRFCPIDRVIFVSVQQLGGRQQHSFHLTFLF